MRGKGDKCLLFHKTAVIASLTYPKNVKDAFLLAKKTAMVVQSDVLQSSFPMTVSKLIT